MRALAIVPRGKTTGDMGVTAVAMSSSRSFLGHAGFYRRFIKDFSEISMPLTNILQKDVPFVIHDDCVEAFKH